VRQVCVPGVRSLATKRSLLGAAAPFLARDTSVCDIAVDCLRCLFLDYSASSGVTTVECLGTHAKKRHNQTSVAYTSSRQKFSAGNTNNQISLRLSADRSDVSCRRGISLSSRVPAPFEARVAALSPGRRSRSRRFCEKRINLMLSEWTVSIR
jgi:hypothetical protein